MLGIHAAWALSSTLTLRGTGSYIAFEGPSPARLSASCDAAAPGIRAVAPTSWSGMPVFNLTFRLLNVATSCINVPIEQPCANHVPGLQELFWCGFGGRGGETFTGPYSAFTQEHLASTGDLLAIEVMLTCPVPSLSTISAVGDVGGGTEAHINVSVAHWHADPTGDPLAPRLAWQGVPAGHILHLDALPTMAPTRAPNAPPSAAPTTEHAPSAVPTSPSASPTVAPSASPTSPTVAPSVAGPPYIYTTGGRTGAYSQSYNVRRYNVDTNTWDNRASTTAAFGLFQPCWLDGILYAATYAA